MPSHPQKEYFPIKEITPYHKVWTIKARVTSKSTTREFARLKGGAGGQGKVFSIDLVDSEGTEIRASFFNEAVTKFDEQIKASDVLELSRGAVKVANRAYAQNNHEYELTFGPESVITKLEDDGSISTNTIYNFTDLRQIKSRPLPATVDFIGVLNRLEEPRTWGRDGKTFTKYTFSICDQSENMIDIAIFGEEMQARYPHSKMAIGQVLCLKGVTVKDFAGRSGVLNNSGVMEINVSGRGEELKKWWAGGGSGKSFANMTQPLVGGIGARGPAETVSISYLRDGIETSLPSEPISSIIYVKLAKTITTKQGEAVPLYYNACPNEIDRDGRKAICNKKCDTGQCPIHGPVAAKKRWLARCVFEDATDSMYLQAFDADFAKVSGLTAEEFAERYEKSGQDSVSNWLESLNFTDTYKIRVATKAEEYMGETSGRSRIVSLDKVSFVERGNELMKLIKDMI